MYNLRIERIKHICIKKLFNKYSFDFDLNNIEDINIIIGPNGYGKTTIFNILNFIFNPSINTLNNIIDIPFEEFTFSADCVQKNSEKQVYEVSLFRKFKEINEIESMYAYTFDNFNLCFKCFLEKKEVYELSLNECVNQARDLYGSFSTFRKENFQNDDVYISNIFEKEIKFTIDKDYYYVNAYVLLELFVDRLKHFIAINSLFMIGANRFQKVFIDSSLKSISKTPTYDYIDHILYNISIKFRRMLNDYNTCISHAKDEVIKKYISTHDNISNFDIEDLKQKWKVFNEYVNKLSKLGVIENNYSIEREVINALGDQSKINFVSLYINTYYESYNKYIEKNKVFNNIVFNNIGINLVNRMFAFQNIINKKFFETNKSIKFTSDGLNVLGVNFRKLSSGEINIIILYYELLFENKKIFLIDEPEISMHIDWQCEFVNDIKEILNNKKCQVIISTHSADIASDVELIVLNNYKFQSKYNE